MNGTSGAGDGVDVRLTFVAEDWRARRQVHEVRLEAWREQTRERGHAEVFVEHRVGRTPADLLATRNANKGSLAGAFKKAGPGPTAALPVLFLLVALAAAGVDKF